MESAALILTFSVVIIMCIGIPVGMCILFVWICKCFAKSNGLPESYKWFGLLGFIGIIIIAALSSNAPRKYPQYPDNQYNQAYNQSPPQNNPYNQAYNQAPQQGGTYVSQNDYQPQASYCPYCGARVDEYAVSCSSCGKMLR